MPTNQNYYWSPTSYLPASVAGPANPLTFALTGTGSATQDMLAFGRMGSGKTINSITLFMNSVTATTVVTIYGQNTTTLNPLATVLATSGTVAASSTPAQVTFTFAGGFVETALTPYCYVVSDTSATPGVVLAYPNSMPANAGVWTAQAAGEALFTTVNNGTSWSSYTNAAGAVWTFSDGSNYGTPLLAPPAYSSLVTYTGQEAGFQVTLPPGPTLRVAGLIMAPMVNGAPPNPVFNLRIGAGTAPVATTAAVSEFVAAKNQYSAPLRGLFPSSVLVPGGSTIQVTVYCATGSSGGPNLYAAQHPHQFGGTDKSMWPFSFGTSLGNFSGITVNNTTNATTTVFSNTIGPFALVLDTLTGPYVTAASSGYRPRPRRRGY